MFNHIKGIARDMHRLLMFVTLHRIMSLHQVFINVPYHNKRTIDV